MMKWSYLIKNLWIIYFLIASCGNKGDSVNSLSHKPMKEDFSRDITPYVFSQNKIPLLNTHSSLHRRDLFKPFENKAYYSKIDKNKQILERFSLDALLMVGALKYDDKWWALVSTKEGHVYKVKKGDHMGKNKGEIQDITENKIYLKEFLVDGSGSEVKKNVVISLCNLKEKTNEMDS